MSEPYNKNFYATLNEKLRNQADPQVKDLQMFLNIAKVLNDAITIIFTNTGSSYPDTVYRGLKGTTPDLFKSNEDYYIDEAFMSTSTKPNVADGTFCQGGTFLEIKLTGSSPGVEIKDYVYSKFAAESEVLLHTGTVLRRDHYYDNESEIKTYRAELGLNCGNEVIPSLVILLTQEDIRSTEYNTILDEQRKRLALSAGAKINSSGILVLVIGAMFVQS